MPAVGCAFQQQPELVHFNQALELTWNLNDRNFPWILLSITFVASPATVALNIVVVTAIMKMKELQTNSNLLLCSLAIADLLVGTMNMPLSVAICFLMVKQVWSQRICLLDILNVYSMYCFSMSSLFHLTVISWERYVAVVKWIEDTSADCRVDASLKF